MRPRFFSLPEAKEMKFGSWENRRICDFSYDDPSHSFYREQNALIKSKEPDSKGESFCELIIRANKVLEDLNKKHNRESKISLKIHFLIVKQRSVLDIFHFL